MSSLKQFLTRLEEILGTNASKDTNRYIKTRIKIEKHNLDICFFKKCLNNETLPPFSRLKIATSNNKSIFKIDYLSSTQTNGTNLQR